MPRTINKATGRCKIVLLLILLSLAGCINKGLDACEPVVVPPVPSQVRELLYFTVHDVITGENITPTEVLEEIELYLFNSNSQLIDTLEITPEQIRSGIPLDVTGLNLEGGYATVWADVSQTMQLTPVTMGARIDDLEFSLPENVSRIGYYSCPGDIFFGYEPIRFVQVSETLKVDTVRLMRKNGKLNVTVRGLPLTRASSDEDYYFQVGALYSGYDFTGEPQAVQRKIWESGAFTDNGDFISPDPYVMIHHLDTDIYDDNHCVAIQLWRTGQSRAEDEMLIAAIKDIDDNYISFRSGMTTNVLILFDETTGEIEVITRITPWDRIYQWTVW